MRTRWHTRFGSWIRAYSVPAVAAGLARAGMPTAETTIYDWVAGRTLPALPRAAALIRLSGDTLTIDDMIRQATGVEHGNGNGKRYRKGALAGGTAEGDRRN